jgi:hypothetical protein
VQEGFDYEIEPIGPYKLVESVIEGGYVHIFSVLKNQESTPKYLIYIVKSSLPEELEINQLKSSDNINAILNELDAKLLSEAKNKTYKNINGVTFEVEMKGGNRALIFLTSKGKNVYQLVFIVPEKSYEEYLSEFNSSIDTFKLL